MNPPLLLSGMYLALGLKIDLQEVALSLDELVEEDPCYYQILPCRYVVDKTRI